MFETVVFLAIPFLVALFLHVGFILWTKEELKQLKENEGAW